MIDLAFVFLAAAAVFLAVELATRKQTALKLALGCLVAAGSIMLIKLAFLALGIES